jgi:transposase-like protein
MKNNNKCPKCNSSDILRVNGSNRGYGAGNNIIASTFSIVNVNRYICCNCGFCEEWIDKEDIPKIKNSKKPRG